MQTKRRLLLVLSFLLPLAMLLLFCAVLGLAPFGTKSLVCSDAKGQFCSYYAFYQDLFSGRADPLYSFEKILGGSTAGLFAYYLASPFNLLLLLVPGERLPLAVDWLILLKLSCCGLTMALYFRSRGRLRPAALLFTTAYALCGYNLAYNWCSMWLDAVILLPLIAWGIDRLLLEDRPLLYLFSLGLAILACFYTGYMLCLFSVLFFLYRLALETPDRRAIPWRRVGRFVLASLGAGALSSVVLIPGVLALSGGVEISPLGFVREYTCPAALYVLRHLFPGRDPAFYDAHVLHALAGIALLALGLSAATLFALFSPRCGARCRTGAGLVWLAALTLWYFTVERHVLLYEMGMLPSFFHAKPSFGFAYFWEMMKGSPNVYIGQLAMLLALGSFFNSRIPARERKLNLLLCAILLLSLLLYLPNLVWHGFEQNNCFNFRYSFVVCFFLLLMAERSFSLREGLDAKAVLLPALLLLLLFCVTWYRKPYFIEAWMYLPTLLWLLLSAAALLLRDSRRTLALLFALQLAALSFSTVLSFRSEASFGADTEAFASVYRQYRDRFDALSARDPDFYRVRKSSAIYNYNDPMLFGYRGLLHFSSAEKLATIRFMRSVGIHVLDEYWANGEDGSSRAADMLFGVRYCTGDAFADYESAQPGLLQNPRALPLAWTAPPAALSPVQSGDDPCENLNALYAVLCPEAGPVFTPADAQALPAPDGELRLRLTVSSPEPLYLRVWTDRLRAVEQDAQGVRTSFTNLYAPAALYLGRFEPGSEAELTLRFEEAAGPCEGAYLYHENSAALAAAYSALTHSPCETQLLSESHILCRAEIPDGGAALVFALPLEDGWRVLADGQPVEPQAALGLFLAVPLEGGSHTLELRFVPPGLIPGALLSGTALALSLLWLLLRKRKAA